MDALEKQLQTLKENVIHLTESEIKNLKFPEKSRTEILENPKIYNKGIVERTDGFYFLFGYNKNGIIEYVLYPIRMTDNSTFNFKEVKIFSTYCCVITDDDFAYDSIYRGFKNALLKLFEMKNIKLIVSTDNEDFFK
ncbi:MAG: hypothetical protein BGO29_04490 [Bacteroidales bacterium 36-12]|nr:MAG: hypothetical protein BGO29_04490 [Bacteroidales bacterium 36-12]